MTRSRYGYAGDDPVNYTDPLGLFGYGTIAAAFGGVVGGLGPVLESIGNDITNEIRQNPGAVMTGVAIGGCIAMPDLCVGLGTVGYVVRAWQRIDQEGWSASLAPNVLDLALTSVSLGVGSWLEAGAGEPTAAITSPAARRAYAFNYGFFDIAGFLSGRIDGKDPVDALSGSG